MAVILGKRNRIQPLIKVVSQAFDSIRLMESLENIKRPSAWLSPQLVVVTDSLPGGISLRLLEQVKKILTPAAMICLTRRISSDREIELRSVGLIFLGNEKTFIDCADAIIGSSVEEKPCRPDADATAHEHTAAKTSGTKSMFSPAIHPNVDN